MEWVARRGRRKRHHRRLHQCRVHLPCWAEGREHLERMADKGTASALALALARDARRAEAYEAVSSLIVSVLTLYPENPEWAEHLDVPTREQLNDQFKSVETKLNLYGSLEVHKLFDEWAELTVPLFLRDFKLQIAAESRADLAALNSEEYRAALKDLGRATSHLRRQMRREAAPEYPG